MKQRTHSMPLSRDNPRQAAALAALLLALLGNPHGLLAEAPPPDITGFAVVPTPTHPSFTGAGYSVSQTNLNGTTEFRCYLHGHHFLSVISASGTFVLRPHPGVDRNGWGSSLYLQPFLSVSNASLGHTVIDGVIPGASGIAITAAGGVSAANETTHGTWSSTLFFNYNPTNKEVTGNGSYSVMLTGPLSAVTGDLNLYKLASNLLTNVPVVSGGMTNTGDMAAVSIAASNSTSPVALNWNPLSLPEHCPGDNCDWLSVTVMGDFNQVDPAALGHCPIQAAHKPTLTVDLTSHQNGLPLRFCGFYETSKAQDFAADNIGINAIIARSAAETNFVFDVTIKASALPQDGIGVDATLKATFPTNDSEIQVFYSPSPLGPFNQLVGSLPWISSNQYQGTVGVPSAPGSAAPERGFFRIATICANTSPPAALPVAQRVSPVADQSQAEVAELRHLEAKRDCADKQAKSDFSSDESYRADSEAESSPEEEDRFSFGKVIYLVPQGMVVREYDFAKDADVEVTYRLLPETETGNISPELPLHIGDDVVVDYREQDGQRFVTTLVREGAQPDHFSLGKVLHLSPGTITVQEFDFITETDVETTYPLLPETTYANFSEEGPLEVGDSVLLIYEEAEGSRRLTSLIREAPQPTTDAEPAADNDGFSFGKVVEVAGDKIAVREYDFAKDADMEVIYQLTPGTEYGGLSTEQPLAEGDSVVVDYLDQAGQRFVTTLVRETVEDSLDCENRDARLPPGAGSSPDNDKTGSAVKPAAEPRRVGG